MGCNSSKTIPILTGQQSVTPVPRGNEKEDTPSNDTVGHLGVVELVDSHHSDGYQYKVHIDITLPMSKQFDKAELTRQVDEEFIKKVNISAEQEREVINCIRTLKSSLGFSDDRLSGFDITTVGGSIRQVAGQFKHSHMRECPLSPEMIEAILSRLVIQHNGESDDAKNKRHVLWSDEWPTISYTDESPMYGKGVREFCFSWDK